jgi:hypothetical protein
MTFDEMTTERIAKLEAVDDEMCQLIFNLDDTIDNTFDGSFPKYNVLFLETYEVTFQFLNDL